MWHCTTLTNWNNLYLFFVALMRGQIIIFYNRILKPFPAKVSFLFLHYKLQALGQSVQATENEKFFWTISRCYFFLNQIFFLVIHAVLQKKGLFSCEISWHTFLMTIYFFLLCIYSVWIILLLEMSCAYTKLSTAPKLTVLQFEDWYFFN